MFPASTDRAASLSAYSCALATKQATDQNLQPPHSFTYILGVHYGLKRTITSTKLAIVLARGAPLHHELLSQAGRRSNYWKSSLM